MRKRKTNLVGMRFGFWDVLAIGRRLKKGRACYWLCRCRCGVEREVRQDNLISGVSTHCGCTPPEPKCPRANTTHGLSERPEYDAWVNMISRCYNPDNESHSRYGGRGIRVCDRWKDSPEAFFADMGARPSPKHTIDRRDNDGDYTPDNCRWATYAEQNRNHSRNVFIERDGLRLTVQDWAERLGIHQATLRGRLYRGWSIERAFGSRPQKRSTGAAVRDRKATPEVDRESDI